MPETKPHKPQGTGEKPWTEEEKSRGSATPAEVEEAGGSATGGRPTDDRADTEGAAARIDPKPHPRP
ncbi:MAG: hypothetical protein JWP04_2141 [Belnapia sp.]|jgi:hypothetical protein|nr:hypothetical protein [Belnapia sp.]